MLDEVLSQEDREDALRRRLFKKFIVRGPGPAQAEPSYGLMARIALKHHNRSFKNFIEGMLIDGKPEWPALCLEALRESDLYDPEEIAQVDRWTPRLTATTATIAEVELRRVDFSLRFRRFCPACLHESPHHRVWFDIMVVERCPFHDLELTATPPDGVRIRWSSAGIANHPRAGRLSRFAERLSTFPNTIETHLLGRLGLLQAPAVPDFDGVSIPHLWNLAKVVGLLKIGGRRDTIPRIDEPGFERDVVRRAGWSAIADGKHGIDQVLRTMVEGVPDTAFGKQALFGWANMRLFTDGFDPTGVLSERMDVVAAEMGRRRHSASFSDVERPMLTVDEVAEMFSIHYATARKIVADLGLGIRREDFFTGQVMVARTSLDAIDRFVRGGTTLNDEEIAALVTRAEVAERLGIKRMQVQHLVEAGLIKPVDYTFRFISSERFDVADIDALIDGLPVEEEIFDKNAAGRLGRMPDASRLLCYTDFDAARFVEDVKAGVLKISYRTGRTGGFRAFRMEMARQPSCHPLVQRTFSLTDARQHTADETTMSRLEAAIILEVTEQTVKVLIDRGLLEEKDGKRQWHALLRSSVDAFASEYVSSRECASRLAIKPSEARARLIAAGVTSLKDTLAVERTYQFTMLCERARAEETLGFDSRVKAMSIRAAWQGFAKWLAKNDSMFTDFSVCPDGSATFSTSVYCPVRLSCHFDDQQVFDWAPLSQTYTIRAELKLEGRIGAARAAKLAKVIGCRDTTREGIEVVCDDAAGSVSASMEVRVVILPEWGQSKEYIMSTYIHWQYDLLHRMLLLMRCATDVGKEYQPGWYGISQVYFK